MALKHILQKLGSKIGVTDLDLNPAQRATQVDRINSACSEIWHSTDLPGSLREVYLCVNAGKILALPPFIGSLRAVRDQQSKKSWTYKDLRPRYHYNSWPEMWSNWTYIGSSALQTDIENAAPLVFHAPEADITLEITTVGETADSKRISDTVNFASAQIVGTKSFLQITSIELNKACESNIIISDADGKELATIYNTRTSALYELIDISAYPSKGDCADGTRVMELLYKVELPVLENDNDTFPLPNYDDDVANKAYQLYLEQQDGAEQRAILADVKINRTISQKILDKEGPQEKKMRFGPNPLLNLGRKYYGQYGRRFNE